MPTKWWIWVWEAERFCGIEEPVGKDGGTIPDGGLNQEDPSGTPIFL